MTIKNQILFKYNFLEKDLLYNVFNLEMKIILTFSPLERNSHMGIAEAVTLKV